MRLDAFAYAASLPFLFWSVALHCGISIGCPAASFAEEPQPVFINLHPVQNKLIIPFSLVAKPSYTLSPKELTDLKGWNHVFQLLVREGVDQRYLTRMFQDSRMPPNRPLYFSLAPKESRAPYMRRNNRNERQNALKFYQKHQDFFEQAEKQFQIPKSVILAIMQIETRCGSYTGNERVFSRLARLASATDPKNIERNFIAKNHVDRTVTREHVVARAEWLEKTFLPHAVASIVLAARKDIHPLDLRGSAAGALGYPQFLPGNYFSYGIDGNLDGSIDLFSPPDAIFSVANFLSSHGWKNLTLSHDEAARVIWHYNRSEPYVETVLAMALALENDIDKLKKATVSNS